ncbi:MAG: methyltransferase domain-containing protein [Thermodesulfovibrionales bacterium]|nr:methyltransferase domain-containing protein [Thermodesulfovibrionales bacterium]
MSNEIKSSDRDSGERSAMGREDAKKKRLQAKGIYAEKLSDELFARVSSFIGESLGIKMPDRKKVMLEARLRKRLRALDIETFDEYVDYAFSPEGFDQEVVHMMDVVTTNKTDFFREPRHYDILNRRALPDVVAARDSRAPIKLWSAGCSSGEEPYTLAIVLSEFKEKQDGPDFQVMGTDVSTQVLYKAMDAIYKEASVEDVDDRIRRKYFLRSRERGKRLVRVGKSLRDKVGFKRINFMEASYDMDTDFDIIFCRNVMIYFDRSTQGQVVNRLCRHLRPGGYLFMGHSETLMGIDAPLKQLESTVYKRT